MALGRKLRPPLPTGGSTEAKTRTPAPPIGCTKGATLIGTSHVAPTSTEGQGLTAQALLTRKLGLGTGPAHAGLKGPWDVNLVSRHCVFLGASPGPPCPHRGLMQDPTAPSLWAATVDLKALEQETVLGKRSQRIPRASSPQTHGIGGHPGSPEGSTTCWCLF